MLGAEGRESEDWTPVIGWGSNGIFKDWLNSGLSSVFCFDDSFPGSRLLSHTIVSVITSQIR